MSVASDIIGKLTKANAVKILIGIVSAERVGEVDKVRFKIYPAEVTVILHRLFHIFAKLFVVAFERRHRRTASAAESRQLRVDISAARTYAVLFGVVLFHIGRNSRVGHRCPAPMCLVKLSINAASVFLVAGSVIRRSAFGADNDIIALFELLAANDTSASCIISHL